ncbi:anticodon-binding domain-containing protein [Powellomyces hirtus]|nr:anticodon-binding domain-containing protein [Powellomyces hirtus]
MMGSGPPAVTDEVFHQDDSKEPPTPTSEASTFPDSSSGNNGGRGYDFAGAVGVWVRVETFGNDVYEGLVYAYDTIFGVLVLQSISKADSVGANAEVLDANAASTIEPRSRPSTPPAAALAPVEPTATAATASKANGAAKPMSFAAAAAAAAFRSSASSPSASKKSSAPSSPGPSPSNGTSSPNTTHTTTNTITTPSTTSATATTTTNTHTNIPNSAAGGGNTATKSDFHIIKLDFIRDLHGLARISEEGEEMATDTKRKSKLYKVPRPLPQLVPFGHVYLDKAAAREAAAVARIGVGVSPEAQTIFDHLAKTLPTRWRKTSILIMDEIEILPPYTPDECRVAAGRSNAENSLARVKKVLEGIEEIQSFALQDEAADTALVSDALSATRLVEQQHR